MELADITWHLHAGAALWLPDDDLTAVAAWMVDNQMDRASAALPVDVQDGQITYGAGHSGPHVRAAHRDVRPTAVPLLSAPPQVFQPSCSEESLRRLQELTAEHEWTSAFDGSCADCSATTLDRHGRLQCRREHAVPWPCPTMRIALAEAALPVPPPRGPREALLLGDCLDPIANAVAFGSPGVDAANAG